MKRPGKAARRLKPSTPPEYRRDLSPEELLDAAWERRQMMARAYARFRSLRATGEALGVSAERVRQALRAVKEDGAGPAGNVPPSWRPAGNLDPVRVLFRQIRDAVGTGELLELAWPLEGLGYVRPPAPLTDRQVARKRQREQEEALRHWYAGHAAGRAAAQADQAHAADHARYQAGFQAGVAHERRTGAGRDLAAIEAGQKAAREAGLEEGLLKNAGVAEDLLGQVFAAMVKADAERNAAGELVTEMLRQLAAYRLAGGSNRPAPAADGARKYGSIFLP